MKATTRPHLRRVELRSSPAGLPRGFPFSVPAIRSLEPLDLDASVCFFVGENGSGKSTLLEAVAAAAALPTVGADPVERDRTLAAQRELAAALRLTWRKRTRRGFFLRAEDFFGFARSMTRLREELQQRLGEVAEQFADASPYARGLAAGPAAASLAELERLYGKDVDARSHGEAFLRLFQARLVPGGLYLLDEPEAALSPQSQLGLMAMMAETIRDGAQFIIASHSPILLAYPGARILNFDGTPVAPARYEELEHVALTRAFLESPAAFLRHITEVG